MHWHGLDTILDFMDDLETAHVDAPPLKRQPGHNSMSCKSENTSRLTKRKKVSNTTETDVSVSSSQS
ncbi:hypothetical protein Q3G72_023451 [Acer saccharum]|nr:hypothetical protein Q3G72_023451 [Acer saccharum]